MIVYTARVLLFAFSCSTNSFQDVVIGTLVLCSVADQRAAVAEIHRVLRCVCLGGSFSVTEDAVAGACVMSVTAWRVHLLGALLVHSEAHRLFRVRVCADLAAATYSWNT